MDFWSLVFWIVLLIVAVSVILFLLRIALVIIMVVIGGLFMGISWLFSKLKQ